MKESEKLKTVLVYFNIKTGSTENYGGYY